MKRTYNGNKGIGIGEWGNHIPKAEKALVAASVVVKRPPQGLWRKKWDCRPNKGNHTWVLGAGRGGLFAGKEYKEWQIWKWATNPKEMWRMVHCSACGKGRVEYLPYDASRIGKLD